MDELMEVSVSIPLWKVVVVMVEELFALLPLMMGAKAANDPLTCNHDASKASRREFLRDDCIVDGAAGSKYGNVTLTLECIYVYRVYIYVFVNVCLNA
jgi:hypothetical protein